MLKTKTLVGQVTALVAAACLSMFSYAEDCPRGTLDEQYCDRDGDLVADLPIDDSQWVDPDTIIFSYTPVEDPAVYAKGKPIAAAVNVFDNFIDISRVILYNVKDRAEHLTFQCFYGLYLPGLWCKVSAGVS